jgi:hypothetical protein
MASDAMTKSFSLTFAKDLVDNFANDGSDQYFIMLGKVDTWTNAPYNSTNDNTAATNVDSVEKANYAIRDGLALKRISSRNTYHMVPRNNWTVDVVYDEFDHTVDMFSTTTAKTFFVYTSIGHLYKCIHNNDGAVSVYEPDHTQTDVVTYADGYRWKFICKVPEDSADFITDSYVPVSLAVDNSSNILNQWNTQQDAVNGSIDYIKSTFVSTGLTAARWIKSSTDNKEIGANASVGATSLVLNGADLSNDTDYYKGHVVYISSGNGVGQRRVITGYGGSNGTNTVIFTDPLISEVTVAGGGVEGSRYQILPNLVIDGDGISAEAIPVLDGENSISSVTVLNKGSDYTIAEVSVYPKGVSGADLDTNVIGIAGPTFSAIIPPVGGHGKNVLNEFGASRMMIRTTIRGTDTDFIGTTSGNDYRQVCIVKNPKLLGGTNDGKVAGTEITKLKQLTVKRPYFMSNSYNDAAFIAGNSVMGETTRATAKIEAWNPGVDDPSVGTLKLSNVQGTFDLEDAASNDTRIIFTGAAGATGSFTVGNTVKQLDANPVPVGKVLSYSGPTDGPYELIVDVTSNSFNTTDTVREFDTEGTATGVFWTGIDTLERKMGELLKHYSSTQGTTFEFKTFPTTDGYQNVARANKFSDVQDETTLENSYKLTTAVIVTDSTGNLATDSYTKDNLLYQISVDNGLTGSSVSGKIVDWTMTNGNTGTLTINDVRGSFVAGGFSGGANHTITTVSGPEIQIGSGEVLYIQNIRPITRNLEQDEEIKIMVGF